MLQQPSCARAGFGWYGGLSREPRATMVWSRGKKSFDFFWKLEITERVTYRGTKVMKQVGEEVYYKTTPTRELLVVTYKELTGP